MSRGDPRDIAAITCAPGRLALRVATGRYTRGVPCPPMRGRMACCGVPKRGPAALWLSWVAGISLTFTRPAESVERLGDALFREPKRPQHCSGRDNVRAAVLFESQ